MKRVPLIFLDFDGVLNSRAYFERTMDEGSLLGLAKSMDPEAIARLNRLSSETGALIVVSSSWRTTTKHTAERLHKWGATVRVIGVTPRVQEWHYPCRGREIELWRKLHPDHARREFVILDDDNDMEPYLSRLVQCDSTVGLQDADVERVKAMFA